jgi:hypothetical protein
VSVVYFYFWWLDTESIFHGLWTLFKVGILVCLFGYGTGV